MYNKQSNILLQQVPWVKNLICFWFFFFFLSRWRCVSGGTPPSISTMPCCWLLCSCPPWRTSCPSSPRPLKTRWDHSFSPAPLFYVSHSVTPLYRGVKTLTLFCKCGLLFAVLWLNNTATKRLQIVFPLGCCIEPSLRIMSYHSSVMNTDGAL